MGRALALWTMITCMALAEVLTPALAQERKSLVTTRLRSPARCSASFLCPVEDLRGLAQRRGQVAAGGYGGIRLTDRTRGGRHQTR